MTDDKQKRREYYRTIYDVKIWLGHHVNQINYTRNLFLTFAVATLGYGLNVYSHLTNLQKDNSIWWNTGLILLTSITFGAIAAGLQAENFRLKRAISRIIEKDENFVDTNTDFIKKQNICTRLEKAVTFITFCQILFFVGGVYNISIAIVELKAI